MYGESWFNKFQFWNGTFLFLSCALVGTVMFTLGFAVTTE